jgi:nucleoside-diphosphate-sugar epimerase
MIAIVTGGTGFLGRRVVRWLAAQGTLVRCLVRATSNVDDLREFLGDVLWQRVEIATGELSDPESYQSALAHVDVVYHLAAGMTGGAAALVLNTVIPTRALAEACVSAKIPRFVLVSSLGVYGAGHLRRWTTLDETCPIDQQPHRRDAYAFAKILQENACREIARDKGLALVVVRPGVIFGPGRGALSTRVGLTFAGWTFRIGSARLLPYTFVDNCAAAIGLAGTAADVIGETFNILDDDLPSVSGVISAYRRNGRGLRAIWLPQNAIGPLSSLYDWYHKYSKGQVPGVITRDRTETIWKPLRFANTKAKVRLAWTPHVPMAEALDKAIRAPLAVSL